jgi:hypothetical protein
MKINRAMGFFMAIAFVVCLALAAPSGGRTLAVFFVALLGYGLGLSIPILADLARRK